MPDSHHDTFRQLPLVAKQRIDAICATFESACRNGTPLAIETIVGEAPEAERPALLAELLHIDIEWRKRRGEPAPVAEYLARFPEHETVVRSIYNDVRPLSLTIVGHDPDGEPLKKPSAAAGAIAEAETFAPVVKGVKQAESLPTIPGYEIDGLLGRGGMGVVYSARQVSLGRRVAIKMVLAGELAAPEDCVRFLGEAEAIAKLRHANIVQIFQVGAHEGRPFIALEYVDGGSLRERLQGRPLPPRAAAALIEKLARAVHHAHQQGIVHRDLTPGNILLAADGEPKITDFGLAKQLAGASSLTATGAVLGTPQYMSPEQARGKTKMVGPAADIYALGAVLYEALAGRPPFVGANAMDVIMQVTADEPMPVTRLNHAVPVDLGTICMKCLEKEPAQRYPTAAALAEDLRRFLNGEPIAARRVNELERAWKWARRRPLAAGSLATAATALIAGTVVSTYFAFVADARSRDAEGASELANTRRVEAEKATAQVRDEQSQTRRREALLLFQNAVTMAEAKGQITPALHTLLAAARAAPPGDEAFDRVVRANLAAWLPQVPELRMILPKEPRGIRLAITSPDGKWLLSANSEDPGQFRLWDAGAGTLRESFPGGRADLYLHFAFAPDSRWLALLTQPPGNDAKANSLQVYELTTGRRHTVVLDCAHATAVRFSRDGKLLFVAAAAGPSPAPGGGQREGGLVLRLHAADLKPAGDPWRFDGICRALDVSPDGQRLLVGEDPPPATGPQDVSTAQRFASIQVIDAGNGKRLGKPIPHRAALFRGGWAGFQPCGRKILTNDSYGGHLWNADTGAFIQDIATLGYQLQFHPGGQFFLRFGGQSTYRKRADHATDNWDATNGLPRGEAAFQSWAALMADGDGLITESGESLYLWRRGQVPCRPAEGKITLDGSVPASLVRRRGTIARDFVLHPRDRQVLHAPDGRAVLASDPTTGRPFGPPIVARLTGAAAGNFTLRPGGEQYAVNQGNGVIALYDAKTGQLAGPLLAAVQSYVWALAYSPDGKLLAIGHNGPIALWDVEGPRLRRLLPQRDAPGHLVFSPDGRRLAACIYPDWNGKPGLQLWDPATGNPVGPFHRTEGLPRAVFAPDSESVSIIDSIRVRRLETAGGTEIGKAIPFPHGVNAVAFTPDGARFLTAGGDGLIQMWNTATGERVAGASFVTWMGMGVIDLVVHPDGRQVLVALANNTVQRWDVESRPPLPLGPALALRCTPGAIAFAHDGRSIITQTTDGDVRVWPIAAPLEGDWRLVERQLEVRTGLEWDPTLGRPRAMDREEWLKRKEALPGRLPSPPRDDDELARDAAQDGNTFAVRWHLDRLIAAHPDDPMLYLRRAHNSIVAAELEAAGAGDEPAVLRRERLEQAAADYDKASAHGAAGFLAAWYSHRALDCDWSGWSDSAAWYLDRALALAPMDAQLHALKALHLERTGKPGEAAGEWATAADGQPAQWIWRLWRSEYLEQLGRFAEAEADLEKAVQSGAAALAPALAKAWARAGKWTKAAALFKQLPGQIPMSLDDLRTWTLCTLRVPDPDGYRRVCQRLMRPAMPAELLPTAIWIATRGEGGLADWQPLLVQAEAWTRPLPEKADERCKRLALDGALRYRAGKFAEAADRLTAALAADGQGAAAADWLFLAMAQQRLGHGDEARKALAKARTLAPKQGGDFDWAAVEMDLLLREAEKLIEGASTNSPATKTAAVRAGQ